MISNSLYHRNFQMKTDMNVKIGSYTKLCMQNKILASKMQHLEQQRTAKDFRFRTSYLEKVDYNQIRSNQSKSVMCVCMFKFSTKNLQSLRHNR